jgi:hypothetical protein
VPEVIDGGCHCGNLKLRFYLSKPFDELPIRACQCSFCRKHNVRATADPDGRLEIKISDPAKLSKYRLGLGITDFIVCKECGVYVSATMEDEENGQVLANCVVNVLDMDLNEIKNSVDAHYDDEAAKSRLERRRGRWMKVDFLESKD